MATNSLSDPGPLGEPSPPSAGNEKQSDWLRLPAGFTWRVVARSSQAVSGTGHLWHAAPDGGATFGATRPDGWIYVSNAEVGERSGGVGAIRFDRNGDIIDAYTLLSGTSKNCAGGPSPWGTWLSCEEIRDGRVWECYPLTRQDAVERPALGVFKHEAVAVDPVGQKLYLTEDESSGGFYRFSPDAIANDGKMDLSAGQLEIAEVFGAGKVKWHVVPKPMGGKSDPTRKQVDGATHFRGGEGIWYEAGIIYFSTKKDNRIWAYNAKEEYVSIVYDDDFFEQAELSSVDNVTVAPGGAVLVAEDGGDMQIVAITTDRQTVPIVQIADHDRSEVTGPAFDPSARRLYFSSQRGASGESKDGVTYEVTGRFV